MAKPLADMMARGKNKMPVFKPLAETLAKTVSLMPKSMVKLLADVLVKA
jgi:hypothetical protein